MMTITISGARTLPADRETVWAALHDAERLKLCVPGCRSLVRVVPDRYALTVAVALGPVRLAFVGEVEVIESAKPSVLALRGTGRGGLAGLAVGTARLTLTETGQGVRLAYRVEAQPTGPLARLGALFIGGVARSLTDRFIASLADVCSPPRADGAPLASCADPAFHTLIGPRAALR